MTPAERRRTAGAVALRRHDGDRAAALAEIRSGMSLELVRELIARHGFTAADIIALRADQAPPFSTAQEASLRPALSS